MTLETKLKIAIAAVSAAGNMAKTSGTARADTVDSFVLGVAGGAGSRSWQSEADGHGSTTGYPIAVTVGFRINKHLAVVADARGLPFDRLRIHTEAVGLRARATSWLSVQAGGGIISGTFVSDTRTFPSVLIAADARIAERDSFSVRLGLSYVKSITTEEYIKPSLVALTIGLWWND